MKFLATPLVRRCGIQYVHVLLQMSHRRVVLACVLYTRVNCAKTAKPIEMLSCNTPVHDHVHSSAAQCWPAERTRRTRESHTGDMLP